MLCQERPGLGDGDAYATGGAELEPNMAPNGFGPPDPRRTHACPGRPPMRVPRTFAPRCRGAPGSSPLGCPLRGRNMVHNPTQATPSPTLRSCARCAGARPEGRDPVSRRSPGEPETWPVRCGGPPRALRATKTHTPETNAPSRTMTSESAPWHALDHIPLHRPDRWPTGQRLCRRAPVARATPAATCPQRSIAPASTRLKVVLPTLLCVPLFQTHSYEFEVCLFNIPSPS